MHHNNTTNYVHCVPLMTIYFQCVDTAIFCGWLVVFNVPSTACHLETAPPSTVHCEGRETRFLHRPHRELNPGSLRGSPLQNRCTTPAPVAVVLLLMCCHMGIPCRRHRT